MPWLFTPRETSIATGGDDKLIKYWNIADGQEASQEPRGTVCRFTHWRSILMAPELASGSVDKTIRIWNVADGKELNKLDGHP